jgi:hypothetical protein
VHNNADVSFTDSCASDQGVPTPDEETGETCNAVIHLQQLAKAHAESPRRRGTQPTECALRERMRENTRMRR